MTGGVLAVDVGNTSTQFGFFQGEALRAEIRVAGEGRRSPEGLETALRAFRAAVSIDPRIWEGAALCSVVPALTGVHRNLLETWTGQPPLIVERRTVPGLELAVEEPDTVGADRLANAVAATAEYGKPCLVVDLGTATTLDVLGPTGAYLGGAIAPGIVISAEALAGRAAQLDAVEIRRPPRVVGRTTVECMQSGILYGSVGGVDFLVRAVLRECDFPSGTPVVATGGYSALVGEISGTITAVDPILTLKGIRRIWEGTR